MGRPRQHLTLLGPFGALMTLDGCASPGAPSLILFGAYFPGWILCAVAGIVAAIVARIAMVMSGLSSALPLQLFVCVALGLLVARSRPGCCGSGNVSSLETRSTKAYEHEDGWDPPVREAASAGDHLAADHRGGRR